jgi:hypothetical protein
MGNGVSASAIANQEGNCSSFREYFFFCKIWLNFLGAYTFITYMVIKCVYSWWREFVSLWQSFFPSNSNRGQFYTLLVDDFPLSQGV